MNIIVELLSLYYTPIGYILGTVFCAVVLIDIIAQPRKSNHDIDGATIGGAIVSGAVLACILPILVGLAVILSPALFWITPPGEWLAAKVNKLVKKNTT